MATAFLSLRFLQRGWPLGDGEPRPLSLKQISFFSFLDDRPALSLCSCQSVFLSPYCSPFLSRWVLQLCLSHVHACTRGEHMTTLLLCSSALVFARLLTRWINTHSLMLFSWLKGWILITDVHLCSVTLFRVCEIGSEHLTDLHFSLVICCATSTFLLSNCFFSLLPVVST